MVMVDLILGSVALGLMMPLLVPAWVMMMVSSQLRLRSRSSSGVVVGIGDGFEEAAGRIDLNPGCWEGCVGGRVGWGERWGVGGGWREARRRCMAWCESRRIGMDWVIWSDVFVGADIAGCARAGGAALVM